VRLVCHRLIHPISNIYINAQFPHAVATKFTITKVAEFHAFTRCTTARVDTLFVVNPSPLQGARFAASKRRSTGGQHAVRIPCLTSIGIDIALASQTLVSPARSCFAASCPPLEPSATSPEDKWEEGAVDLNARSRSFALLRMTSAFVILRALPKNLFFVFVLKEGAALQLA
jgi:hypothetical protein